MINDLFMAIKSGDVNRLSVYLAGGGNPDVIDEKETSWTLLKTAVAAAHGACVDAITLLLRYRANPNGTGLRGGVTPLLLAVSEGNMCSVRLLLSAGADLTLRDEEGDFPLLLSVLREDLEMARLLLLCGAVATINDSGSPSGMSSLGVATARLNTEIVQLLLAEGADPEACDGDHAPATAYLPCRNEANADRIDHILKLIAARNRIKTPQSDTG